MTKLKPKINTCGCTDLNDFFRLSGILEDIKLTHTPFIVFLPEYGGIQVKIIDRAKDLLKLPDDIQVMAQWKGQWRSNFFQFKVGDLRRYLAENPR